MFTKKELESNLWLIFKPFTPQSGIEFIFFAVFVAVLIWIFEEKNWRRPFKEHLANLNEVIYDLFSSLYQTNTIELRTISSRIMQFAFWVLLVLIVTIYQADLTTVLSSRFDHSKIFGDMCVIISIV